VLISVEELKLHPVSISKTYPAGALDYKTTDFRQLGSLKVQGVAELAGMELRFRGRLSTQVEASCDRCLGTVEIPVESNFDLIYRPMQTIARQEEVEVPAAELEVGFYTGPGIELAEVVTEQVNLAIPMKIVCRVDCQGLCPTCGINRNLETCHCTAPSAESPESPFAALLGD
jgi:uncharacterized protein